MSRLFGYFSFQGRANRARYWVTAVSIVGLTFVCALAGSATMAALPILAMVFGLLLLPIFLASLANSARRLHDRNKSAWWLLVFQGVPMILSALGVLVELSSRGDPSAAGPSGLLTLIELPILIWA